MIANPNLESIFNEIKSTTSISGYLFVHYGKIDQEMAVSSIQLIERKLNLEKFERNIITKTKSVCIEILQNIIKHQTNHNTIFPYFILANNGFELSLFAGNVITNESKELISQSLNSFQLVEKNDFKKYYLDALHVSALSPEGNAGMGLMDIVLKSNKQFKYEIKQIANELYSYDLKVILKHTHYS